MSIYTGRRVTMRDSMGEWWEAYCLEVIEEDGSFKYHLRLENGDSLKIAVEDITAILEKGKKFRPGRKVIPFPKKKRA